MILELCDEKFGAALRDKFDVVIPGYPTLNTDVLFVPEENALRYRSERAGRDKLEFISFYRVRQVFSKERYRTSVARSGISVLEDGVVKTYKAVPVDLYYDVVYWTKLKRNANAFEKEYYFWWVENPNLTFKIAASGTQVEFELDMHFGEVDMAVTDWFEQGRYFKSKGQVIVDSWLYKSDVAVDIEEIHLRLYAGEYGGDATLDFSEVIT